MQHTSLLWYNMQIVFLEARGDDLTIEVIKMDFLCFEKVYVHSIANFLELWVIGRNPDYHSIVQPVLPHPVESTIPIVLANLLPRVGMRIQASEVDAFSVESIPASLPAGLQGARGFDAISPFLVGVMVESQHYGPSVSRQELLDVD